MTEVQKTTIRPNIANMTKTPGGSYHKPDFVGYTLAGLSVAQVVSVASEVGVAADKYSRLNPGQQRMTLGNTLRKLTNIAEVPLIDGKPDQKTVDKNEEAYAIRTTVEDMADKFRAENAAAKEAKAAEKAEAAAAKKAAKEAKPAEKAEAAAAKKAAKEAKPAG